MSVCLSNQRFVLIGSDIKYFFLFLEKLELFDEKFDAFLKKHFKAWTWAVAFNDQ